MRLRQQYILELLRRIQDFMTANATLLGALNTSTVRANLDALVAQMTADAAVQGTNKSQAMGATTSQKALRAALLDANMRPIAKVAKTLVKLNPALSAVTVPDSHLHSQALINAATSMAQTVTPFEAAFVAGGLAPAFIADLQAAAAALGASIDGRSALKASGAGATANLADESKASHAVIYVLNSQIMPLLAGNTTLVAAWKVAKRVTAKPGVPTGTSVATPPAPVTPVTPATPLAPATPASPGSPVPVMSPATPLAPAKEVHAGA